VQLVPVRAQRWRPGAGLRRQLSQIGVDSGEPIGQVLHNVCSVV
jgi:hypothetical protein